MRAYHFLQLGRTLFATVLVMGFSHQTVGADTSAPSLNEPTLLKVKEIEATPQANPSAPAGKTAARPDRTPLGNPTQAKTRVSASAKPVAGDSVLMEPALEAPQELPPSTSDQPAPLRIEIPGPAPKAKTPSEPKVLTFKPEADSTTMADRLKASASTKERNEPTTPADETPSNDTENIGDASPKNDENMPEEELQPIAEDASGAPITEKRQPNRATDEAAIRPIPDGEVDDAGPAPLEAASFNGVTPGQSTLEDVEKAWGPPKEMYKEKEVMTQLYAIEPFDRIEVGYENDVVISIIVRFQKPFSAAKIAQQLDMADVKPVLISNDMGEILGQSYPERGVLFAFEPGEEKGKPSYKVIHIMLEPISAEPFILRAETAIESRYDRSLQDLQIALELQPENARANWLMSRVLSAMEQFEKAEAASAQAVQLEPENVRYCLTHAQILGQMGRIKDALQEVAKAIENSTEQPHLHARALCLMGDLIASGPMPNYRKAIGYHAQSLQAADKAAADERPAVRKAAKEVLVDSHLGSAHDIAWGDWKEKEKAVTMWLKRAVVIAEDLMKKEGGTSEQLFRVHNRALSALVGIRSGVDPKPWLEEAVRTGNELIGSTSDPIRKAQYQWDLGMAMYDAVQICQLRSNHALAREYGEAAIVYLEQGYERKQTPATAYLLGRLYFRMGAIHAIRDQDHTLAVTWFDKAVPLLDKPLPPEAMVDLGRFGETYVSMGVSYWETGDRTKAIELTQKGIQHMEDAVSRGVLDRSALAVPYSNLSAMQRQVGDKESASKYSEMAARIKNTKTR